MRCPWSPQPLRLLLALIPDRRAACSRGSKTAGQPLQVDEIRPGHPSIGVGESADIFRTILEIVGALTPCLNKEEPRKKTKPVGASLCSPMPSVSGFLVKFGGRLAGL